MRERIAFIIVAMLVVVQLTVFAGVSDDGGVIPRRNTSEFTGPQSRGVSYIREDTNEVAIGNDNVELVFSKLSGGGLDKIIDKQTGEDLRSNKIPASIMFLFFYWTGSALDIMLQWDANSLDITNETGTGYAKLTFDYSKLKGANLNATVTVEITDNATFARMRLDVENDEPSFVIKFIFFH